MHSKFDELGSWLAEQIIVNSTLISRVQKQRFIDNTFRKIHEKYEARSIDHNQYTNLVNRLAAYDKGQHSQYIDSLTSAAQVGKLDVLLAHGNGVDSFPPSLPTSKSREGYPS